MNSSVGGCVVALGAAIALAGSFVDCSNAMLGGGVGVERMVGTPLVLSNWCGGRPAIIKTLIFGGKGGCGSD